MTTEVEGVLEKTAVVRTYPDNSLGEQVRTADESFSVFEMIHELMRKPVC
ncbi:hypothetical protein NKW45_05815 [Acetobacter orientalis]|nr:hypothetical protein [Acetobacter orientalis]MCP1221363.1 hypothetical protein [Acetobacter orientalis]